MTPQGIFQQRDLNNFFVFYLSILIYRSIDRESLHYFVLKKISCLYTAFYCCGMLYILTRFWVLHAPQSWSKYFLLAFSDICLLVMHLCQPFMSAKSVGVLLPVFRVKMNNYLEKTYTTMAQEPSIYTRSATWSSATRVF